MTHHNVWSLKRNSGVGDTAQDDDDDDEDDEEDEDATLTPARRRQPASRPASSRRRSGRGGGRTQRRNKTLARVSRQSRAGTADDDTGGSGRDSRQTTEEPSRECLQETW